MGGPHLVGSLLQRLPAAGPQDCCTSCRRGPGKGRAAVLRRGRVRACSPRRRADAHRYDDEGCACRGPAGRRAAPSAGLRPLSKLLTAPDPSPVIDLIDAFRRTKAMFAAVRLGIFDRLQPEPAALSALATV